jgi:hypothetical protein
MKNLALKVEVLINNVKNNQAEQKSNKQEKSRSPELEDNKIKSNGGCNLS